MKRHSTKSGAGFIRHLSVVAAKVLLVLTPLLSFGLKSQTIPLFIISGQVVDDSTGAPISLVNVFVANSTLGTSTNATGAFEIKNAPAGYHDVVASIIGYKRQTISIHLVDRDYPTVIFRLRPSPVEIGPVNVVAKYPTKWKENLERFQRLLLGTSENASQCKIVNAVVLDFTTDNREGLFGATAREPLIIENRALGYKLSFYLEEFSLETSMLKYVGSFKFEELAPANEPEKLEWGKMRAKAYKGSFQHFLSSLVKGTTLKEGFRMFQVPTANFGHQWKPQVQPDSILSATGLPYERILSFPHYIEVTYQYERADPEFKTFMYRLGFPISQQHYLYDQTSWISMSGLPVRVSVWGQLSNPYAIVTYGYWAYERVAEMVPIDYRPE
jgi:hypothetical protein